MVCFYVQFQKAAKASTTEMKNEEKKKNLNPIFELLIQFTTRRRHKHDWDYSSLLTTFAFVSHIMYSPVHYIVCWWFFMLKILCAVCFRSYITFYIKREKHLMVMLYPMKYTVVRIVIHIKIKPFPQYSNSKRILYTENFP